MQNYKRVLAAAVVVAQLFFISAFAVTTSYAQDVADQSVTSPVVTEETAASSDASVDTPATTDVAADTTSTDEATAAADTVSSGDVTPATPATPAATPALSTDKDDYHPAETATIFGRFFAPLQNFILKIFGSDDNDNNYTESTQTVTSDENGSFSSVYNLDNLYRPFYQTTVSTIDGALLATGLFRDSAIGTYDQCSNDQGTGYTTGAIGCHWINGNLNGNNSKYQEGDSTVQRLWIEGYAPGSTHSVTFQYGTTKAGKHAYDYLTTWDASENWIVLADRCLGITGCTTAGETTLAIPHDSNGSGQFEFGTRNFVMRGATLTSATAPSIANGSYAGDSDTAITVSFTVPASGAMCSTKNSVTSCGVALWFGAHIAKTSQWSPFNGTTGAGSINGSPYHVSLAAEDGASVGNRDNQMQASAVVNSSIITIHKVTGGNTSTSFTFNTTGTGYAGFSLVGGGQNSQSVVPGTYTVTEPATAGWNNSALTCTATGLGSSATANLATHAVSIVIGSTGGAGIDCTYTNALIPQNVGAITIKKVTVPSGDTQQFAFSGAVSGSIADQGTLSTTSLADGTYTVTESATAGWDLTSISCVDGNGAGSTGNIATGVATINVNSGETVACTYTNTKKGHLVVNKVTDPASDPTSFGITASGSGTITGAGVGSITTAVPKNYEVTPGTYSVAETAAAGWSKTGDTCQGVVVAAGQTANCTITNTKLPKLTVTKVVINDNGGTKVVSDFPLFVDATGVTSGVQVSSTVGAHTVSETGFASYTGVISGDCAANGSITLAAGDVKACTITNNDIAPKLHIRKVVINNNGGTATAANFTLTADGTGANDLSGTSPVDGSATLQADTFALSETNLPGYTASAWSCVGGTQNGSNITVGINEEATCTITNDDQQAYIIVDKTVVNDNGGSAAVNDFLLTVDGGAVLDGVAVPVTPGVHTAGETNLPGYTAGTWGTDCSANGSVTVALGETKTCTITNDDQAAHLIVVKHVVNDNGGTMLAGGFTTTIGGVSTANPSAAGSEAGVDNVLTTVGTYTVDEGAHVGYDKSLSADCAGTIALGQTKTCTITNDDQPGTLIVKKVVVNGDTGATTAASAFSFSVNAGTPISFEGDAQNDMTVNAGTYSVTEPAFSGYTTTYDNCSQLAIANGGTATCTITNTAIAPTLTVIKIVDNGNTGATTLASAFQMMIDAGNVPQNAAQAEAIGLHTVTESGPSGYSAAYSGDCDVTGNVLLALGDAKTCTITNTAIAPTLTLVKIVMNDNGGTAVAGDFQGKIDGSNVAWNAAQTMTTGAHSASEVTLPGYTPSDWGTDCSANGSITLALGENKTCTITNDDQPGTLIVKKVVVNDNGGVKNAQDFSFKVNGGADVAFEADAQNDMTVNAGTYSVAENASTGYTTTYSNCTGVVVPNGGSATCTITNNDIAPKLHLRKVIINNNGGTATAANFTLTADGTGANDLSGTSPVDSTGSLVADTFALSETNLAGYTASAWSCVGGTQNGANVTVGINEEATCTITNDDIAPRLIVIKHVINDSGDVAVASDFTMHLTGSNLSSNDFAGSESGVTVTLNAGTYSANEVNSSGYQKTLSADCSGTIAVGQTKTCTITNNDTPQATRTLGFWQTHTAYTSNKFTTLTNPMKIGTNLTKIDNTSKLFGAFYASIPKKTVGGNRSDLDKARMTLLQQLVAAKLNCAVFGCSLATAGAISNADTAYQSGTAAQILTAASIMDAFNNSNDALPISGQGSATPSLSKTLADLVFWNVLP